MRFTPYYFSHLAIDYIVFVSIGMAFVVGTQVFGADAFKSTGALVSLVSTYCGICVVKFFLRTVFLCVLLYIFDLSAYFDVILRLLSFNNR